MKFLTEPEVILVDKMGSDLTVANAARVSFDKNSELNSDGTLKDSDAKLINYLAKHKHWTPFGHVTVQFRIKAPVFVARQLVKHQVGLVWNEVSRRYVDSEPEFYLPKIWRERSENVKQGSSEVPVVPKGSFSNCPNCDKVFTSNNNRQRYCCADCQSKHYRTMPWGWAKIKVARLKQSAEKHGIVFNLTDTDIEMPVLCPYLGTALEYGNTEINDNSASVDRIDSSIGYVPGNIQTISFLANKMKSHATHAQLIKFAKSTLARHTGAFAVQEDGVEGVYKASLDSYNKLLAEGVCPEQARMILPLGSVTEWYWTGSVAAFARVCKLRLDPHSQKETQDVAAKIDEALKAAFPVSWSALMEN